MFTRAKYEVSDVLNPMDGFVPGYSTHTSLRSVPDCGEPDCVGLCDHCEEYKDYCERMDEAKRDCKVQQAHELGGDPDSVLCDCQICSGSLDLSETYEE